MTTTIHKWRVPLSDEFAISMPIGAKILCIQEQNDFPQLWALVDPGRGHETRHFIVYGTGHEMRDGDQAYVGTFQIHQGALVFHVFESPVSEETE